LSSPFDKTGRVYCIAFLPKIIRHGNRLRLRQSVSVAQAGEHVLGTLRDMMMVALTFSPDGKHIASSSVDYIIRIVGCTGYFGLEAAQKLLHSRLTEDIFISGVGGSVWDIETGDSCLKAC